MAFGMLDCELDLEAIDEIAVEKLTLIIVDIVNSNYSRISCKAT